MSIASTFKEDCLKDRIVLITGGLGSIGEVCVKHLAAHGAKVAVNDIHDPDVAADKMELGDCIRYFQADVTDEASVARLFDEVESAFGPPDVVFAHAGMVEVFDYWNYPVENFEKLMDLNVKGGFLVSREAVRRMKGTATAENPGRIIFTSSWVQDTPWPQISAYNASKSAVKMLMRTLAREVATRHILVNSMAPGIVAVGLAKREWDSNMEYRKRAQKAIPLGFMQPPESIAESFVFLASDASKYMTGANLLVDGGCSLYPMDE